jgi:hypothetical protein
MQNQSECAIRDVAKLSWRSITSYQRKTIMGTVTYQDGITIIQLIIFPFVLVASLFIWKRTGWRIGSKIWRYPFTLFLIRLAGSIATLISINNDPENVRIAMFVCQLIGIARLLLAYVGMLRLM